MIIFASTTTIILARLTCSMSMAAKMRNGAFHCKSFMSFTDTKPMITAQHALVPAKHFPIVEFREGVLRMSDTGCLMLHVPIFKHRKQAHHCNILQALPHLPTGMSELTLKVCKPEFSSIEMLDMDGRHALTQTSHLLNSIMFQEFLILGQNLFLHQRT